MSYYEKNKWSKGTEYCLKGNTPEIEAIQWLGDNTGNVMAFSRVGNRKMFDFTAETISDNELVIHCSFYDKLNEKQVTLGVTRMMYGDFLIRLNGDNYTVCSPEIFDQLFQRRR